MAEESGERQSVSDREMTRRGFMFRFGLLFNAVAGVMMALPIIGYVASTLIYRDWQQWIELGQVDRQLLQQGGEAADSFQGVLVTVDPERDTAEILGPYATAFSPRFLGVLGERGPIAEFAQQVNAAFGKVPDGDGGYTMDHTGNIIIINPRGHYHGFIKLPHKAETIRLAYQSLAARF